MYIHFSIDCLSHLCPNLADSVLKQHGVQRTFSTMYHKRIKIAAFRARMDQSKALKRNVMASFKYKHTTSSSISPYFFNNHLKKQQKPLVCTLLKHEAEAFRYKSLQSKTQLNNNEHEADRQTHSNAQIGPEKSGSNVCLVYRKNYNNEARKPLPSYTVNKTTSAAATNASRQYPRLSSRNVLDKYAHLFGLQPVRSEIS